ncbi:type II secretion system protein GspL [Glaciecola sp. 1036]|uniref:type II secretion system protein GspL n=1 Tax=Alteromonadaceae TaxID=72275 RepID=UPI003D03E21D
MQQLVIRLGSQFEDPIQWLGFDTNENEVIASGELSDASKLSNLQEHSHNATVIALAPSADLLVTDISLPKKQNRKLLSAVQYMLEDKLCFDVDTQFVAKGNMQETQLPVAVVDKGKLAFWRTLLDDAGIFCQRLIPDCLLLPNPQDNQISVVKINNDLIVRTDAHHGVQGEVSWLLPALLEAAQKDQKSLVAYSELDAQDLPESIEYNYDHLPLELLRQNISANSINLFQGEYSVKAKTNPVWSKWKAAAVLAMIALTVNLVMKTVELNSIKQQRADINQRITQTVSEAFPSIQRVRKDTLKRTIAREMQRLETTGGGASFLAMLSQMSDAFKSSGVTPQTLSFNGSRTELRMQSVADNFEALERFRREVSALGLTVEQGAINNRGDQVVGVIVVKG